MKTYSELLTDPRTHDPEDFAYITHGIVNWDGDDLDLTREFFGERIGRIRDPTQFYNASLIGVMSTENAMERLGYDKELRRPNPAGMGGLILKPPEDSIYVAWNFDLGTPTESDKLIKWTSRHRGKVKPPIKLLSDKHLDFYNHIVIRGDEKASIEGVFYSHGSDKAKEFGTLLKDSMDDMLGEDLPLIGVPHEDMMPENDILWWMVYYLYNAYIRNPSRVVFYLPLDIQKRLGVVRGSETL
jgi:hypothetical protein